MKRSRTLIVFTAVTLVFSAIGLRHTAQAENTAKVSSAADHPDCLPEVQASVAPADMALSFTPDVSEVDDPLAPQMESLLHAVDLMTQEDEVQPE